MFEPPVSREAACHWCGPHPVHLYFPCEHHGCACLEGATLLGIDTALGG
jgi:hypothetical protein